VVLVPNPGKDGKRRYGAWAGNPNGHAERWGDCIAEVADGVSYLFHQCRRRRGYGPDQRFCKQHAKQAMKE
jgi:hypothetical protein